MDIFNLSAVLRLDSSQYEQGISDAESKASGLGKALGTAAKVGAGAFAAVGAAVAGVGASLIKGTGNVAAYGDNIDKMSQKMGLSAQAYQEWDAVMQHSGTSMEAMKASMKTLANAAETGSDAFEKLGISQKELNSLSQEQLFERTISALQQVEDETTRTYLAGKTLGRGATELGALLNTSAEDTQAMRDRVRELGGVMSDEAVKAAARYQDSLQDMTTAIDGTKREIESEFLPSMATIMDGLTEIFAGYNEEGLPLLQQGVSDLIDKLGEMMPRIILTAKSLIQGIGQAIVDNLPSIVEQGTQILISLLSGIISALPQIAGAMATVVTTIASTIISNLPVILSAGMDMISSLGSGILQNAPVAISAMGNNLSQLVASVMQRLPEFLSKGVELIGKMANGILQNAPAIISAILQAIAQVLATIASNLPQFLAKGLEIIGQVASGIIQAIPQAVAAIPQVISGITNAFTSFNWLSIGSNIISGIASGIRNAAGSVIDAVGGVASSALNGAKRLLGIASPSKIFRDQVGKMIPAGMALGVEETTPQVVQAVEDMNDDAFDAIDDVGYDSGVVVKREERGKDADPNSVVVSAIQQLADAIYYLDEGLYNKMVDALESMRFDINEREFGRLVRDVRV